MLLYLGFPICRIKRMILSFLCKMPERCRERGGCHTPGVSARTPWYKSHCSGTREIKKKFISARCLFSICRQWQSWQGHHSPCLTGKGRKWRGQTTLWFAADRKVELRGISGFMQIFWAVMSHMYTSIADWYRAYAFCAIFSLIG